MKTIIAIVAVLTLGTAGYITFRSVPGQVSGNAVPEEMLFEARRGPMRVTITENGSLMAKNSEKVSSKTRRGGQITFLIEEGKTVEEGEVLCRLDTTDLEERKNELALDITQTEADLKTAQTELKIQTSDNEASIEKAEIALEKAQKELERYEQADAPKERRQLNVSIKEAETNFSRAKKKYEDSLLLREKDYITESTLEQDQIDFERAEIQLESANRDLDIFEEYTFPMTLKEKKTAVADAEREAENAVMRAESNLRQKEVAVERQENRLEDRKQRMEEVQEEIDNFTITAPSPGIVLYGDPTQPWYREEIKLGGQVWGGFTLFTIPDLRVMQVQIQVHEADIIKVAEDQPVKVTMDTYPGLVLNGKVTKIATIAGGGQGNFMGPDQVKKFTVDITMDEIEDLTLKPGISAKAEIFVEERDDVLYIPIQCVFIEEGVAYCHILGDNGEPVRLEVKPGISNDTYIEILEGLDPGDRVLLFNPTLGAATAEGESSEKEEKNGTLPSTSNGVGSSSG